MKNEPKTITLDANDCVYVGILIKKELDIVSKSADTATDKKIIESHMLCKARLQRIYDILCE